MSQPYTGEIRMFAGNFAPVSWAFCDGSLLAISNYQVLFTLIGTFYGGDGVNTFALPDLRGRVPVHQGTSTTGTTYVLGEHAGVETVTLTVPQMAAHTHAALCNSGDTNPVNSPSGAVWLNYGSNQYTDQPVPALMHAAALASVGGGQPHENRMPYQVLNFIICLFGTLPSQN